MSLLSKKFDPLEAGLANEPIVPKTDDNAVLEYLSPRLSMLGVDEHALRPGWSDESPSLTDSLLSLDFETNSGMSSTLLSSGGFSELSPLETPLEGARQQLFSPLDPMPLSTGDMETADPKQDSAKHSPGAAEAWSVPAMRQDFTLFPSASFATPRGSVGSQSASSEILSLLDTLNEQGNESSKRPFSDVVTPTASLQEIVQPAKPCAPLKASASPPSSTVEPDAPKLLRTTKRRRREADELLPIDAPIQPRRYLTESATSRRDSPTVKSSSEQGSPLSTDMEDSRELDARSQKRLSNTLAARRSRHRKAEELKRLYETIASLEKEAALWKQRCEVVEKERDRLLLDRQW
ncbi:hypothetical protein MNAN1_002552 [Malassezia nana]|uniref:BZIP domain-containing protein n=1 Tax=Malassezia nana TaxID=180528 RepID=A0AAF0ELG1_9BASI|nr:hypothetical protein MNAN1_002552 [Malassezia nana]